MGRTGVGTGSHLCTVFTTTPGSIALFSPFALEDSEAQSGQGAGRWQSQRPRQSAPELTSSKVNATPVRSLQGAQPHAEQFQH